MLMRSLLLLLLVVAALAAPAAADPLERFLAAHPLRNEVTVLHAVKNGTKDVGATVEWRGEVLDVSLQQFVLQIGPYKATVHEPTGSVKLSAGEPVRIIGTLTSGGDNLVVDAVLVAPQVVRTTKGIGWNPDTVSPQLEEMVSHWGLWVQSFNRHLTPETAGLYTATVFRYSRPARVDPRLVLSVVAAESAFEKDAVSNVGAIGLGQLMPGTAVQMGVLDIHDPVQNLQGSIRLLGIEMRRWQGLPDQYQRVLASYNAGEGAVEQYNGIPPYAETRAYVTYVLSLFRELAAL